MGPTVLHNFCYIHCCSNDYLELLSVHAQTGVAFCIRIVFFILIRQQSKVGTCLQILMKLQNINDMKILVAVMQLSEDVRTDRQTGMANWQYAI